MDKELSKKHEILNSDPSFPYNIWEQWHASTILGLGRRRVKTRGSLELSGQLAQSNQWVKCCKKGTVSKNKVEGYNIDLWPLHVFTYMCTCIHICTYMSVYTHAQHIHIYTQKNPTNILTRIHASGFILWSSKF